MLERKWRWTRAVPAYHHASIFKRNPPLVWDIPFLLLSRSLPLQT